MEIEKVVLADGDVLPCCRAIMGGNKKLEVLGNIKDQNLETIWKGERLSEIRKFHMRGESHKIKMCQYCGLRKRIISLKSNQN